LQTENASTEDKAIPVHQAIGHVLPAHFCDCYNRNFNTV